MNLEEKFERWGMEIASFTADVANAHDKAIKWGGCVAQRTGTQTLGAIRQLCTST